MVILVPDETTRIAMLKTGTVDIIGVGLEGARDLNVAGFKTGTLNWKGLAVYFHAAYQPECAGKPIADIRVRQALSLAINRDEIRKNLLYGVAAPPAPPFLGDTSDDIDVPYWMDYCAKAFRYDPQAAKQLLNEAGYPGGFSIKLWTCPATGASYLPDVIQAVAGYWLSNLGVKADIVLTDEGTYLGLRNTFKNPTLIGAAGSYKQDIMPTSVTRLAGGYHSQRSAFFLVGKAMPELDSLLDSASTEMDDSKRQETLAKAIKMAIDSYTCLTLCQVPMLCALGPAVDVDFPKILPSLGGETAIIAKHSKK
jgi:peptide/nickel transport system substrate-binding protein